MTQVEAAKKGIVTPEMQEVAKKEGISVDVLLERVAKGTVVIPCNKRHTGLVPCGIGEGLRVKINANIGASSDRAILEEELKKLEVAIKAGADTVMDLSTGGDLDIFRRAIIKNSSVPVGTVPIYQAAIEVAEKKGGIIFLTVDEIFSVIEKQAEDGVDFMTVHSGLTLKGLELLKEQGRVTNIVSRGGSFLTTWMLYHEKENPLYEYYDRLLEIAKKYDITLSLGDSLRPGSIMDATDRAQIHELIILGELVKRARENDVQAMVEGPGHVPLNQIETNIKLQKSLCEGAPFYVLGPVVTDIASGYDHVAAAIGGAIAGACGADFLCYVTPAEHLCLPDVEDVREGVIAAKIAAHAADIARGNKLAIERDRQMSIAREKLDWETQIKLSIDPEKARQYREKFPPSEKEVCTMCGKYCAIKQVKNFFRGGKK
jgi:phosphomethylpyrimidine synthase